MLLHRLWLAAGFCLLGTALTLAQGAVAPPPPTPGAVTGPQVSNSDVIVSGSVTGVQDIPTPGGGMTPGASPWGITNGAHGAVTVALTIKPAQVLLGTVPPGPLTVLVINYGGNNPVPMPKVGDSQVFFLQRTRDGFTSNLSQGVKGIDTLDAVTKLVQTLPLTVKLTAPETPLYFGEMTPVTITLVNNSATALQITSINLSGYYYAPRMENYVQSMISFSKDAQPKFPMDPLTLDANGKQTITVYVKATVPPSLALLGPDSYVVTVASLHLDIRYSDGTAAGRFLMTRSNWVDAMVGYPHTAPAETPVKPALMKD